MHVQEYGMISLLDLVEKGPGIVLRIFADQDFNITERK